MSLILNKVNKIPEEKQPASPKGDLFAEISQRVLNLAKFCVGLDGRLKKVENLPAPRDGRDGRDGKEGKEGRIGPVGPKGLDGKSITKARIDNEGSLIVSIDNIENNLGKVVGRNGLDGIAGLKGSDGNPGESIKGDKGDKGLDGKSILDVKLEDGCLIVDLDGEKLHLGNITGEKGEAGTSGKDGKDGKNGKSILDVKLENDNLIINLDGDIKNLGNIKGSRGDKGQDGKDGVSVKGDKGDIGPKGDSGPPGESIKGDKGDPGKDFDPKELNRLDNEISSIRQALINTNSAPEMTNGELAWRIKELTGKSVKID